MFNTKKLKEESENEELTIRKKIEIEVEIENNLKVSDDICRNCCYYHSNFCYRLSSPMKAIDKACNFFFNNEYYD